MNTSDLGAWYQRRAIVLWVEDQLTRAYLRALWDDKDITYLVAGGNDAVVGTVRDARRDGATNVFGLQDRDFGDSNAGDWGNPKKRPDVLRPTRHEVENFLLRPDILAALPADYNPQARTRVDLERRAKQHAEESLWWMVFRAVIHDVRREVTTDSFPRHPKWGERSAVTDPSSTVARLATTLRDSEWGRGHSAWASGFDESWIAARVAHHAAAYQSALVDGSWATIWSGKDVFKELAGYVNVGKRKGLAAEELAFGIGRWQNEHERTGELWDAHASLRSRVSRSITM